MLQKINNNDYNNTTNNNNITSFFKLIEGDLSEKGNEISDESIDFIFTDPPYSTESIYIYSELAVLTIRVLKPGGSIVTYIGQHNLPEILDIFTSNNLKYWWPIAVKHTGATTAFHQRKVFVLWKPLLWFVKGDRLSTSYPITALNDYLYDFVESKPVEKLLHPWEQSTIEAEHVIKKLTLENDIVLDPLMGSGTTGIAALNLKRKFIGIEKDHEKFLIAKRRIGEFVNKRIHFQN
jgi:DNA modification methylase